MHDDLKKAPTAKQIWFLQMEGIPATIIFQMTREQAMREISRIKGTTGFPDAKVE